MADECGADQVFSLPNSLLCRQIGIFVLCFQQVGPINSAIFPFEFSHMRVTLCTRIRAKFSWFVC